MGTQTTTKVDLNCLAWTEYRKKNGLDPLGMQVSSVNFYQALLPGISNVTLRMRYYGLYAWLSWMYAQHIGDTDPDSWRRIIRRTEALYALIALRRGGETGVAGVEWADDTFKALKGTMIDFAEAAEIGPDSYFAIRCHQRIPQEGESGREATGPSHPSGLAPDHRRNAERPPDLHRVDAGQALHRRELRQQVPGLVRPGRPEALLGAWHPQI